MTNGASNYDEGKPDLTKIPPEFLFELARAFDYGARKYGDDANWRKGMHWRRHCASLQRHVLKWLLGEDMDEESGVHHLCCAAVRIAMLYVSQLRGYGVDDRWKEETPPEPVTHTYSNQCDCVHCLATRIYGSCE